MDFLPDYYPHPTRWNQFVCGLQGHILGQSVSSNPDIDYFICIRCGKIIRKPKSSVIIDDTFLNTY